MAIPIKLFLIDLVFQFIIHEIQAWIIYNIMDISVDLEKVFSNLMPMVTSKSHFKEDWQPCDQFLKQMKQINILVVGAGGLGSELMKNLALSGFFNIDLVDMDTIDLSNLNRQFLFRESDIGQFKADVVARFIKNRCPWVKIKTFKCKVQQIPFSQYAKYHIIIGGLDNVEARSFLNKVVFQLNVNQEYTVCSYIDGATEGFQGQVILVEPFVTSCYDCSLFGTGSKPKVNYCTLAHTPRTPQHCIQYVLQIQWEQERGKVPVDFDNIENVQWVYKKSLERAEKFKIQGITEMLTLGVGKNIIPAIASTNALIAASCTNEAFKIITGCHPPLNNYFFYKGGTSIDIDTYKQQTEQSCHNCHMRINRLPPVQVECTTTILISQLIQLVKKNNAAVNKPFINYNGKFLMNPFDQNRYDKALNMSISEFITEKNIQVQDKAFKLLFSNQALEALTVIVKIN